MKESRLCLVAGAVGEAGVLLPTMLDHEGEGPIRGIYGLGGHERWLLKLK
jgi:hypothetical protein